MRNLLVTGGAGFIGANFVHHMLRTYPDYHVVVFDKLTYAGNLNNLKPAEHNPRFAFVQGDICDAAAVRDAIRRYDIDTIVNFAAESVVAKTFIPVHYGHGIKLVTAEELFTTYAEKCGVTADLNGVESVEPRLPLFALSFRNGMGQWRRITHITRHTYVGKVVTLRQKWGSVTVTPNHSVYNADAQLVAAETNPELLAIRKINVDCSHHRDHLDIHLPDIKSRDERLYAPAVNGGRGSRDVYVHQTLAGEILLALMRFLGAYAAEGSAVFNQANGAWQVCIANQDPEYLEQLRRDAMLFTNAASSITFRERPNAHQLTFSSHILYLLVTTLCGGRSHEKKVPDALYTLAEPYKRAFLDSYLRGDGNIQRYKTVDTRRLTTNSPKLAAGIGLLLSLMGLDYSVSYREFGGRDDWHPAYTLNIVSHYDARTECTYSEHDYEGYVYDLTVEGTHNFAAGIGNIVVHNTHVDRSILDPDAFVRTNVYGVFVLCEATKDLKLERLHHISTDEVYGPIAQGMFSETDRFKPTSPYAAAKAGGELLALSYFQTYGVPLTVTRGVNTYGPYQYPEKAIPLFITNAIDDQPLPLYGDGKQVRDRLHVSDHARAVDVVLHAGTLGEAYNVAADMEHTNIEVARRILAILGKPESLIQPVLDRAAHDVRYALDADKLGALGWEPGVDFETGLAETVRWYVENEWWWRTLKSGEYLDYYRRQYTERTGT